jgi:hypothetical protein
VCAHSCLQRGEPIIAGSEDWMTDGPNRDRVSFPGLKLVSLSLSQFGAYALRGSASCTDRIDTMLPLLLLVIFTLNDAIDWVHQYRRGRHNEGSCCDGIDRKRVKEHMLCADSRGYSCRGILTSAAERP